MGARLHPVLKFCRDQKISLRRLAEAIGYSAGHLSEVSRGKTPCSVRLSKALSKYSEGQIDRLEVLDWPVAKTT